MSDGNAKVVITFKAGPEYDAPWVVIHGDTVDEAGQLLQEVRVKGVFAAVRAASAEFQAKPVTSTAQAVSNVQAGIPGSTVIKQELPESMRPKCSECGAAGVEKSGHSSKQNRDYRGVFCPNDHKPIEFTWTS